MSGVSSTRQVLPLQPPPRTTANARPTYVCATSEPPTDPPQFFGGLSGGRETPINGILLGSRHCWRNPRSGACKRAPSHRPAPARSASVRVPVRWRFVGLALSFVTFPTCLRPFSVPRFARSSDAMRPVYTPYFTPFNIFFFFIKV